MVAKKSAPKKKVAVKKKPTAAKRTKSTKVAKQQPMRSFQIAAQPVPFKTFKVTRQTVYWLILLAVIAATQLWILKLQMDIATLTESIVTQEY
jgi:hypothetical protein